VIHMCARRPLPWHDEDRVNARYRSMRLDAGLSWARPCIDQMADLMQEIRPR
jgi:hypothetical protein